MVPGIVAEKPVPGWDSTASEMWRSASPVFVTVKSKLPAKSPAFTEGFLRLNGPSLPAARSPAPVYAARREPRQVVGPASPRHRGGRVCPALARRGTDPSFVLDRLSCHPSGAPTGALARASGQGSGPIARGQHLPPRINR